MATFGTFVSGQVLTAAELNTAGEWQDFTPTFTQSATITKTVNFARYTQLGKWVQVQIRMTATGAGTANNIIKVGLPVNASANNFLMGSAYFWDGGSSGTGYPLFATFDSASTCAFIGVYVDESAPGSSQFGLSAAINAVTVANTDVIFLNLAYEAA